MDTTRALVSGEPMEMEEQAQGHGSNPLLVVHLLLQGRYWLAILLAIAGAATGGVLGYKFTHKTWSSIGMIQVKPVTQPILFQGSGALPPYDGFVQTQMILLKSQNLVDSALSKDSWKDLGGGNTPEEAESFRNILDISRDGEMIIVRFVDMDPNVARAGVKSIIWAYNDMYLNNDAHNSELMLTQLEHLRDTYNLRLKAANDQVNAITKNLGEQTVRDRYSFKTMDANSLEAQWQNISRQLQQWEALHPGTTTAPAAKVAVAEGTATKPAEDVVYSEEYVVAHDVAFAELVKNRDAADRNLQMLAGEGMGPNNPSVTPVKREFEMLSKLAEEKRKAWKPVIAPPAGVIETNNMPPGMDEETYHTRLVQEEKTVKAQWLAASDEARNLGQQVAEVTRVNLDTDETKSLLDTTKMKIEQISVEASTTGRIEVISNGDRPVMRDMRVQMAGAAGFGGGIVGFGLVILLGLMDRRLRTIDQARMSLKSGMRVLGMLPSLPKNIEDPGAAAFAALCVHHIRMLLQVMPRMDSHPAIAVTSPSPGDGKTSLTLSLALSFAASGKSTLLIDCDIVGAGLTRRVNAIIRRRIGQILIRESLITPAELREALSHAQRSGRKLGEVLVDEGYVDQEQLTRALAMQAETSVGLLDVMRGEVLEECVADTGIARLWILPVGSALAEHGATISPEGFRAVLEQARKRFDVVLVDTGPIPGSIESSVAASQVDGVVLCVSRGEQGPLVRRASDHLTDLGARALGIVFNRAKPEDFSSSYGSMSSPSIPARAVERPAGDRAAFGPVASAVAGAQTKPKE